MLMLLGFESFSIDDKQEKDFFFLNSSCEHSFNKY